MKGRQLITAIRQNNMIQFEQWFDAGLDVNHRVGKYQDTLLHAAVTLKSIPVVEFLLDVGADHHLINHDKITPIELAMLTNQPAMMAAFLNKGKFPLASLLTSICTDDIELFTDLVESCEGDIFLLEDSFQSSYSVLHYLAALGRNELATCLFNYVDLPRTVINKVTAFGDKQITPLLLACRYGHPLMVSWLLARGANILLQNEKGEMALTMAIHHGNITIVKQLVEKIPSLLTVLQEKNLQNHDAIEIALLNRKSDVALFLFQYCPSLFEMAQQASSENAYFHLAVRGGVISVVKAFLAKKTFVDLRNMSGKTALMCAVEFDEADVFKLLHQAGANLDLRDEEGNTAFLLAAKEGADNVLDYCLKQKIDIESQNAQKETALILAAGEADSVTLKLLLSHHANIYHENVYGSTVLHRAAYYGNWENVLYLVKYHHLSVWKQTKSGDIPLDSCLQGGLRLTENELQAEYTALKLVTLMYEYDLKQAYHHLLLLNAYSQRVVEHLRIEMDEPDVENRFGKNRQKLRNIRLNHLSEMVLTEAIASRLAHLQRLLFEYVILFIHSPGVFQMLPQEVLVEKILCGLLEKKTGGLIDLEDTYLIHGLLNSMRGRIKQIQKVTRRPSAKSQRIVDEKSEKVIQFWLTQRPQKISYKRIYTDLLQWIEKQGIGRINDLLPQKCAPLFWKRTPLTAAIENDFEELVSHCLLWGANPNQSDEMGEYPLHLACYRGSLIILGLLLQYDVKPSLHQRNARGNYPLHEAVLGKNPAVLEMLFMHFNDFQIETIEVTSRTWRKPQHALFPLEVVNDYGETVLELAYTTHQLEMTECLLERHVNFYRFIERSPQYLNVPSTPSGLEGFKYHFFSKRFLFSCSGNPYDVFKNMVHDVGHFSALHQSFSKVDFYDLKFKLLKFCKAIEYAMPYPTSQLIVIRDFLTHFSVCYLLKKDRAVNFFRLKELLLDFQRKLSDSEVKTVMKQVSTKKDTDDSQPQIVPKADKRLAWRAVMLAITQTALFEEALSMKITHDYPHLIPNLADWQYVEIMAFQIEAAKEIFTHLVSKIPHWEESFKSEKQFLGYARKTEIESALGLLHDFYQCINRLTAYPYIEGFFLNADNSMHLESFFKELRTIQKSIFKLSDEDKKEDTGLFNEDFAENEVSAKQNESVLKMQAVFKMLKTLSELTILSPEKQPVLLPHSITKISHRFVFFGNVEPKEVPQQSVLKMNFPKPH